MSRARKKKQPQPEEPEYAESIHVDCGLTRDGVALVSVATNGRTVYLSPDVAIQFASRLMAVAYRAGNLLDCGLSAGDYKQ